MIQNKSTNRLSAMAHGKATRILTSKLSPPVSGLQVVRTEILERLNLENIPHLVLISAPAGYGKTSVMAQYARMLEEQATPTFWLTLDKADNDIDRLISYIRMAILKIDTDSKNDDANVASFNSVTPSEVATDYVYQLNSITKKFAIFFDEFEVIQSPAALDFFRQIVLNIPVNGRIIIGSRNQPRLGIARLRAHGNLLVISANNLQFSLLETEDLLRKKRELILSDEEIATLYERTEGWVSALQLASLSLALRRDSFSFISSFSGKNAQVVDYLAEDVFTNLENDLKDFLLATCILDELSVPLCNALTGQSNSAIILDKLERDGVFLSRSGDQSRTYRYHALFAEFLRDQLSLSHRFNSSTLHLAASRWFESEGRPVPAIEHALLSKDYTIAMQLLHSNVEQLLMTGRIELLRRWFEVIPASVLQLYPEVVMIFALALPGSPRYPKMMKILDGYVKEDGSMPEWTVAPRAYLLTMEDKFSQCYDLCKKELTNREPKLTAQDGLLTLFYAHNLIAKNETSDAIRYLNQAKSSFAAANSVLGIAITDQIQAMMEISQGRLRDATLRLRNAYSKVTEADQASLGAIVGVALAIALYEGGDLLGAEHLLNQCLALTDDSGHPDVQIRGKISLARIANTFGKPDRALEILADLEGLGHRLGLKRLVANAWLERSRMALVAGDLTLAEDFLKYADDDAIWNSFSGFSPHANDVESVVIGRIRLLIHTGQVEKAIPLLKSEIKSAVSAKKVFRELKLQLLLSYSTYISGDQRTAMRMLKDCLAGANREGCVALFTDEGPRIKEFLKKYLDQISSETNIDNNLKLFLQRLISNENTSATQPFNIRESDLNYSHRDSPDALTRREIEVLRLMSNGLSNKELGDYLFVSESTIKTHLARINTKLGAKNRTQAVVAGRKLGIIE